ncbi:T9SS type A sorting domain-containing protein [Hanstruepera flava]|uniref:T9SS type A sorting domain-containing protein n=1 Tax=Hanstruepera flava TaxID=2930218 RepID=UPI002028A885|nr:T9SS type A sorting domain-containing protein [Hanstruepera flava]
MKTITLPTIFLIKLSLYTINIKAQDGYTYTLLHNGGYDFIVQAVPNSSSNNFATSVQSYGFTIILPDGVTITQTSSLGNGADTTFFDGTNVGMSSIDGYLITETLSSPIALLPPSSATNSDVFSFTVNGNPSSGELYILENNSTLATTVTPLKSFMQADMVDDSVTIYTNVVDANGSAVSGMSSFSFDTLGINTHVVFDVSISPNPTTGIVNIKGVENLKKVTVYTINGQLIKSFTNNHNIQRIDIGTLPLGIYVLNIHTESGIKNIKLIKR